MPVWRNYRRIGMSRGLFVNALLRETGRHVTSGAGGEVSEVSLGGVPETGAAGSAAAERQGISKVFDEGTSEVGHRYQWADRFRSDDAPPVPMQLGNPETGDFRGYEVDLLGEIARRAGFRVSYPRDLWSAIVSELMTGEVDLICQLLCAQVVTLASRVFIKSKIA